MEPRIVEVGRMVLLGLGFFGDPFRISDGWTEENEIGRLWHRFMAVLAARQDCVAQGSRAGIFYEVHIQHEETAQTGEYEVFTGFEVDRLENVPVEMSVKVLPPATYAVFTLRGEEITSDWHQLIYTEWMQASGYRSAHPFGFQRYDERFKGVDRIPESVLEVYVPIARAVDAGQPPAGNSPSRQSSPSPG
jgi:predicted transcriptional regulator YdeE